jgi:thymidylate synthase (FAD)
MNTGLLLYSLPLCADLNLMWRIDDETLSIYLQRGMLPAGLYSQLSLAEIQGKMLRLDLTPNWQTREPSPMVFVLTYKDGTLQRISDEGKPLMSNLKDLHIPLLDHGFIRVVDVMGDDAAIVQAARVSYGKGTKSVSEDAALIDYLIRHKHTSPLEMCEIKLHLKMPLFVMRQWIRHRMANVNEYSARYSVMEDEFYIPKKEHLAPQSTTNNQGRSEQIFSDVEANDIIRTLKRDSEIAYSHYLELMNQDSDGQEVIFDRLGLSRELARINLPVNIYTQCYWKIDLHNLLHFLRLRADSHAQYEIRVYAQAILDQIVAQWVPLACASWKNHVQGAVTFAADEWAEIKDVLLGREIKFEHPSKGRMREFVKKIQKY